MNFSLILLNVIIEVIIVFIVQYIFVRYVYHSDVRVAIETLTRQAARWTTASLQDENAMISLLHANYGMGYLSALHDIATDRQIEDVTGIDIHQFQKEITDAQDKATMRMVKLCPDFAPKRSYLTDIAKE
jgi:hypothetical protein